MSQADYLRGLGDAAELADFWARENYRLATDTILHDPIIGRKSKGRGDVALSEQLAEQGRDFSNRAHAFEDIAKDIRAKMERA